MNNIFEGGEDMPVNLRDYINDEISLNVLAQEVCSQ